MIVVICVLLALAMCGLIAAGQSGGPSSHDPFDDYLP
jgi:hypothetical protein